MADKWVRRWKVPSESDPDKEYTVAVDKSGNYGCSCPRWTRCRHKIPDGQCKHIKRVLAGGGYAMDEEIPSEPEIILAMVKEVTPDEKGLLTPLIPIGDTHFQATLLYDLLRNGVRWPTLKARYDLAKRNSRAAVVAYVRERGRKVVLESNPRGYDTYHVVPAPLNDGL